MKAGTLDLHPLPAMHVDGERSVIPDDGELRLALRFAGPPSRRPR